jgi:hypothetical protein
MIIQVNFVLKCSDTMRDVERGEEGPGLIYVYHFCSLSVFLLTCFLG